MTYKKNIPIYFIFTFLIYFYIWMPIWVVFFQDKGMNLGQIGLLNAAGYLVMALAEIPTGVVADKYGRKYSLAIGALIYGLGMLGVVTDVFSIWFILGFVFWNIANPFFTGASTAILYESLILLERKEDFQKLAGRSGAIIQVSQISGSIIGGILAAYNMELCFIIAGLLSIVAMFIALLMKEPVVKEEGDVDRREQKYWSLIKKAYSITIKNPSLLYLLLYSSLLSTFVFVLTYTLYQPYAIEIGFTLTSLGILVFFLKGAQILGNLLTDRFTKLVDAKYQIFALPLIISIGMIFMGAITVKFSIVFLILITLASGLISPTISRLLNDEIPSSQRATILSFQGIIWTAIGAGLDPFMLYIADYTSPTLSVLISGFCLLLLSVLLSVLWVRAKNVRSIPVENSREYN